MELLFQAHSLERIISNTVKWENKDIFTCKIIFLFSEEKMGLYISFAIPILFFLFT